MSQSNRVVFRNSLFGVASEVISGTLFFLTFILIARSLGVAEFGSLSFLLAIAGVFQLLADFGLTNVLVREIARDRTQVDRVMGAVRPLAWITSLLIFLVVSAIGFVLPGDDTTPYAMMVLGLAVLATFHSFSYGSVCRAFEEMGFNALGNIIHKILLIILVYVALELETGVMGVAVAMLAANVCQWAFFYAIVRVRYLKAAQWRVDVAYWKFILTESAPIGLAMVFRRVSQQTNILILTMFSTTSSVGLFTAAYKIIQMLDMIPFTLAIPQFPLFVRLAKESNERLFAAFARVIKLFMIAAAPIVVWTVLMGDQLILLLFGADYLAASDTLKLLTLSLTFLFITALYPYLFSALDRQKFYTVTSALCLLANVILGCLLVPSLAHLGAAIATLVAEMVFCLCGLWLLRSLGFRAPLLKIVGMPFALAVLASPIAASFSQQQSIIISLLAGIAYGVVYLLLIVVTRTLDNDELSFIKSILKREHRGQAASDRT